MSDYKNFAFISYSRVDWQEATYIQSTLEHFRYPKEAIHEDRRPPNHKFVREIFLDKTSFSGRGPKFSEKLEDELSASKYLIVVCSPDAARPNPSATSEDVNVEWEIETFLKKHGDRARDRIIPVIARGEPDKSEQSCLPRPIRNDVFRARNLPDMRLALGERPGFFGRRKRWHSAIVTLLSYAFDVERAVIHDRFAAERARLRLKIAVALGVVMAIVLGLGGWALFENARTRDNVALQHLMKAQSLLEHTDPNAAFGESELALAHLSAASRLSVAREYFANQLAQRSWIVPLRKEDHDNSGALEKTLQDVDAVLRDAENILQNTNAVIHTERMEAPRDFPLSFVNVNGRLMATAADGSLQGWKTADGFFVFSAKVSPVGTVMATLRHNPDFSVDGLDPYTGRLLWTRSLKSMLRDYQFSEDGRCLAILSMDGRLTVLNALTGCREFETVTVGSRAESVKFSPSGTELTVVKSGEKITLRLMKNLQEFPISVKNSPLDGCSVSLSGGTFSLTAQGEFGRFVETYDSRTLMRLSIQEIEQKKCSGELAENEEHVVSRTMTGRREVRVDSQDCYAATVSDKSVRLFDAKSGEPISEAFDMPAIILHLNFISNGQSRYLLVGGSGEITGYDGAERGFYAVIDVENRTVLRIRNGLDGCVTESYRLGGLQCLLHGVNNVTDWVMWLPARTDGLLPRGMRVLCQLLSDYVLSDREVPVWNMIYATDCAMSGLWKRFLTEVNLEKDDRHISYLSQILETNVVERLACGGMKEIETLLSVRPDHPDALSGYCIPFVRAMLKQKFARLHSEKSLYEVDLHFAAYSPQQWCTEISKTPEAIYFMDKITDYALRQNPTSEVAKKTRDMFLRLSGQNQTSCSVESSPAKKWKDFLDDPKGDILANREVAAFGAEANCVDKQSFCRYLGQLQDALVRSLTSREMDLDRVMAAAYLVGEVSVWAQGLNACEDEYLGFVERLASHELPNCLSAFREQFREQLLFCGLEKSIRIGDATWARRLFDRIGNRVERDSLSFFMLQFYSPFVLLCEKDSARARQQVGDCEKKDENLFKGQSRQYYEILTEMKDHGVALGELMGLYDQLVRQHATGVEIQVVPGKVAEKLGWQSGDRIMGVNGMTIIDKEQLYAVLSILKAQNNQRSVAFVLSREGKSFKVSTFETDLGIRF